MFHHQKLSSDLESEKLLCMVWEFQLDLNSQRLWKKKKEKEESGDLFSLPGKLLSWNGSLTCINNFFRIYIHTYIHTYIYVYIYCRYLHCTTSLCFIATAPSLTTSLPGTLVKLNSKELWLVNHLQWDYSDMSLECKRVCICPSWES